MGDQQLAGADVGPCLSFFVPRLPHVIFLDRVATGPHFVPGLPHVSHPDRVATGPHVVPGLPHVTLLELRLALISYQDYHMLLPAPLGWLLAHLHGHIQRRAARPSQENMSQSIIRERWSLWCLVVCHSVQNRTRKSHSRDFMTSVKRYPI